MLVWILSIKRRVHIPGDLCNGTDDEMMVNDPFIKPDDPSPATARATINIFEDVARPQRSDPSSNMKKKTKKVHYELVRCRFS